MHARDRAEMAELVAAHLMANQRTAECLATIVHDLTEIVRRVRSVNALCDQIGLNNNAARTILAGQELILDDAAESALEGGATCLN